MKAALKYAWDQKYVKNLPEPTQAAREIERLRMENGGEMRAQYLVDAAKEKANPFHDCFPWDHKTAANEHWLHLARVILGNLRVVRETGTAHHAYFQVRREQVRFYTPASEIQNNADYMAQLLKQAESYYIAGRARFDEIKELQTLHEAIDQVFTKTRKPRKSRAA